TAARGDSAIVDDGADVRSHALSDLAAECRDALAIEVGFEAVADSFVQENSRPAGAEHNFHFARGCVLRIKLHDRLPRGFLGETLRRFITREEFEANTAAAAA